MAVKTIKTKIVGVTYKNTDGTSRQQLIAKHAKKRATLRLIHEPDNKYGADAIGIWLPKKRLLRKPKLYQLGYLASENFDIVEAVVDGRILVVRIIKVTGGKKGKNYGVSIQINLKTK